jgi:hypothetical protein
VHSSLASGGVCRSDLFSKVAGGLLHHRFTLTLAGGLFSVALSVGFAPAPAVVSRSCGSLAAQPLAGTLPCDARTFLTLLARDRAPFRPQIVHNQLGFANSSIAFESICHRFQFDVWEKLYPAIESQLTMPTKIGYPNERYELA